MGKQITSWISAKKRIDRWRGLWEEALTDVQRRKLKLMLDGGNLIFFFRFNGDVFGTTENARVVFAKMKDPDDEDHTPGWLKEANFIATNLTKLGQGQRQQIIFTEKDLKNIDVLDREEAYRSLEEFFEKEKNDKSGGT